MFALRLLTDKLLSVLPTWLRISFIIAIFTNMLRSQCGKIKITDSEMNSKKDQQYYLALEGDEDFKLDMDVSKSHNWYGYINSHAAHDMENFRKKYLETLNFLTEQEALKLNIEDENGQPNVEFYKNEIPSEPDRVYIREFHSSWVKEYKKLEYVHSYIQWLFPIQEHGMNYLAVPLSHKEIQIFRQDNNLKKELLKSYKLMLDFYGIKLVEHQEPQQPKELLENQELQKTQEQLLPPISEVCRADNWKEQFENLNRKTHNNLRITRILKCLALLGLEEHQAPLVKFFLHETLVNKTLPRVKQSVLDYFIFSVVNDKERNELIKFAFQHFEPKENFVWCPKNSKIYRKIKNNPDNQNDNVSIITPNLDDLENNDHPKCSSSTAGFGINTGRQDQHAENQDKSQTTDTKKYPLLDYGRGPQCTHDRYENGDNSDGCVPGNQAKDINTDTKTKSDEPDKNKKLHKNEKSGLQHSKDQKSAEVDEIHCAEKQRLGGNNEDSRPDSARKCENPTEDPDTYLGKKEKSNLQAVDQNRGSIAGDESATFKPGTNPDSGDDCSKAEKSTVPSDKTTNVSPCENPTEDTDTDTKPSHIKHDQDFLEHKLTSDKNSDDPLSEEKKQMKPIFNQV